jgi:hypothetical protein
VSRIGRAMTLYAAWYISLFFGTDILWHHVTHHDIPTWLWTTRLAAWLVVMTFDKIPGYKRFVGDKAQKSSDVIPEAPTGPLVGWRAWRSPHFGLISFTTSEPWPTSRPYEARCPLTGFPNHGIPPGPDCRCGIYVFADPGDARNLRHFSRFGVYGPVLTWGRTQVHETGWRSEYARPLALVRPRFLSPKRWRRMDLVLERLGRQYGIPVLSFGEAKRLADRMAQKGR